MGTRGAFGVIIGEREKIGYNQYDSYPSGKGLEALHFLRGADLGFLRTQAEKLRVVGRDDSKPTPEDVAALKPWTDLGVSEQSVDDWYCLTRGSHGDFKEMLECGYVLDSSDFPLDSVFCEWGYIVDLDQNRFEVYKGFTNGRPTSGRWAGRPTPEEDTANYKEHLYWCAKNDRQPWMSETPEYGAIELIASWPLDKLPSDVEFLTKALAKSDPEYAQEEVERLTASQP
jgi:hypothetical protein